MSTENKTTSRRKKSNKRKPNPQVTNEIFTTSESEIQLEVITESFKNPEQALEEVSNTLNNLKISFTNDLSELGKKLEETNNENNELRNSIIYLNKTIDYKDKLINNLKEEINELKSSKKSLQTQFDNLKNLNLFQRIFSWK